MPDMVTGNVFLSQTANLFIEQWFVFGSLVLFLRVIP